MGFSGYFKSMSILSGILLGAGTLLILYCVAATLFMGPVSFNAILFGLGVLLMALAFLNSRYGQLPAAIHFKKIAVPIVLILLVCFSALEALVISGAARKDTQKADYIIVLGAGLRGEELTLTLLRRLEAALACWQGETFVVTGGQGPHESIAEGVAMARWLEQQGVPKNQILVEDQSTNTHENLDFSKKLIESHSGKPVGESRIKIVTSDFHSFRARMLARRQGFAQVSAYGGQTPALLAPAFYIREGLALVKSFLFDW